jgi:RNA polymerase sigma factor (sigma-70 family)
VSKLREEVSELYRRHATTVFRRALRILGSESEAHEVVQDLFVSLLERPEQFAGRSTLSTFMYSATTHACLNRLRNQRNRARILSERGEQTDDAAASVGVVELVTLHRALARLPAPLAEVAVYYFVDELSHNEIAGLLGCSRRHIGDLLQRVEAWGRSQERVCSND